jgi:hypothetical protein
MMIHNKMGRPKKDPSRIDLRLGELKYEGVDDSLTAAAGLPIMLELFSRSRQFSNFIKNLPTRTGNNTYGTERIALLIWLGFLRGFDCIEDLADFEWDAGVMQKFGEIPTPRSIGNYLRDFSPVNNEGLNEFLRSQAMDARKRICPEAPLIIDVDSTSHVQRGETIEGLAYNYKHEWCLDSLVAFDSLGFCHGMKLRPGNTFSSQGAGEFIREIFPILPVDEVERRKIKKKRFFRADSAFCEQESIHACMERGVLFTISAHGRTGWKDRVKAGVIQEWSPWKYSQEELLRAERLGTSLPEVELGSFVYQPSWNDGLRFYHVVKRTWVTKKTKLPKTKKTQEVSLDEEETFVEGEWMYYGVLTNWNLHEQQLQDIMVHHHGRGHAENFIREGKYGYDLKHFPCKKITANHAYGLLALAAHNFIRIIALLDSPAKPQFVKAIRKRFIFIPGKVITSAKQWWMKIPNHWKKEVDGLLHAWARAFLFAPALH